MLTGLKLNQTYQWHIRAKCGKIWTVYAPSVSFKTSRTGSVTINSNGADKLIINEVVTAGLRAYPNPTHGQFVLTLKTAELTTATARILLLDANGKTLLTENAVLFGGVLQKTMRVPSAATKQLYVVQVQVNNKIYSSTLIYLK